MGMREKRKRDPRRRRTVPRVLPVEREDVDPRDETADITHRTADTHGRPPRENDAGETR